MAETLDHTIEKFQVSVNCSDQKTGFVLKDQLAGRLRNDFIPEITAVFNAYCGKRLDFLQLQNVNITIDADKNWDTPSLLKQLREQLQSELAERDWVTVENRNTKNQQILTGKERQVKAFVHFLQTGRLPWYFADGEKLDFDQIANAELPVDIFRKTETRRRLIYQFLGETAWLSSILKMTLRKNRSQPESTAAVQAFWNLLKLIRSKTRKEFSAVRLFNFLVDEKPSELLEAVQEVIEKEHIALDKFIAEWLPQLNEFTRLNFALSENITATASPKIIINKTSFETRSEEISPRITRSGLEFKSQDQFTDDLFDSKQPESLFISNAGLILLHPYLGKFFQEAGLLISKNTINPQRLDYAVHLLHFLATGNEQPREEQLTFEKYLCGVTEELAVRREIKLSKKHQRESEALLEAVIGHWSALRNTSVAGLRGQFITRKGKLLLASQHDKLFVERVTADVLLDKIPWGIGLVKLPWLEKLIYVNW
ncbi:MAG: contractile injection system tape measure protein [Leeuwenhoekiella sp.]